MSNYSGFDLPLADTTTLAAGAITVKVWDVTHSVALADVATDGAGHVAAGTLPVDAGTLVRFRVENDGAGRAGFNEIVTF
jgi:hypothetical protein